MGSTLAQDEIGSNFISLGRVSLSLETPGSIVVRVGTCMCEHEHTCYGEKNLALGVRMVLGSTLTNYVILGKSVNLLGSQFSHL